MHSVELKFIVDRNVGRMAKWLRMAGFDAVLAADDDDEAMIAAALAGNRILLTRDRRIMKRRTIARGHIQAILIGSDRFGEQVRQVCGFLRPDRSRLRPFTICLECNRRLEERDKEAVKERLPPHVYLTRDRFSECPACGRLYWQGTHWQAMSRGMEGIWGMGQRHRPSENAAGDCGGGAGRSFVEQQEEISMKDVDYMSVAEDSMSKIGKGAFLTVQSGNALNTMTIGWATFGVVWGKRIMMVAVRSSRHTFGIIEAAKDFTVTVPAGDMHEETAYCGSKSGRNVDKFKMCNLETVDGRQVDSPRIKTRGRHYECRIIYKSAMDPAHLDRGYDSSLYPKKDYHTLYFGEIMACYETE